MSSTLGDLIDSQFGTRFLIPWKWLTPNSRQTLEIVFQLTMDSEQDFSEGFALHHLYYVNLNDVKAIRYLDGHKINIALEEIKKIVSLGQYQELPTLDDREFKAEININTFEVYDDMIRKATNIEDLAEAILARLEAENAKKNVENDLDVLQKKTQYELINTIVRSALFVIIGVGIITTFLYVIAIFSGKETQIIGSTWSNMFGILLTNAFSIVGTIMGVKYASENKEQK